MLKPHANELFAQWALLMVLAHWAIVEVQLMLGCTHIYSQVL
jgi:hypothetical protein